jgi:ribosome recycling factor
MDQEEMDMIMEEAKEMMDHSIDHLSKELLKVRTGKASANMVKDILVPYYGSPTPMSQVANITTSDSRTLVIKPWEGNIIPAIEKAIMEANIGITPQNDGEVVRLTIPMLTEDRRKDLVKQAKALGEDTKVGVRNARRQAMEEIKKGIKSGYPEDMGKRREEEIQKMTDGHVKKIDEMIEAKEKDIMTV